MTSTEFPGRVIVMESGQFRCGTWCYMGVDSIHGGQCPEPATHDESTHCEHHSETARKARLERTLQAGRRRRARR